MLNIKLNIKQFIEDVEITFYKVQLEIYKNNIKALVGF
tara:strand:- start:366 stop:479 length:114 start_codon:yes stop_codon:yes gene_type:complete